MDFTSKDEKQIADYGIELALARNQMERFKKGFEPLKLTRASKDGDGILRLSEKESKEAMSRFESYGGSIAKFVPASGAATRMFKSLFEFFSTSNDPDEDFERLKSATFEQEFRFFKKLDSFAFFPSLKDKYLEQRGVTIEEALLRRDYAGILEILLKEEGINYGSLPKGLLSFHQYGDEQRTPALEQLVEGALHTSAADTLHLHFTVSPDHADAFSRHLDQKVIARFGEGKNINISYSAQQKSTDTLAANLTNEIFRDEEGHLIFRPAGHGALLENLNRMEEDIVFIKNIDNVFPDRLKSEVVMYKKILAGVLLSYQKKAFDILLGHNEGKDVELEASALLKELGSSATLSEGSFADKLNRPIRVCGMVKNVGEPGGGPFWVEDENGTHSLQIVESAQVDSSDPDQVRIFNESTHFNPVDLVCGLRNFKGEKFDLLKYRDEETGFITEKSFGGEKLKAMELPGLWNGGMANWNTIFVEVPLSTFSPVKTVNDLLKDEHTA